MSEDKHSRVNSNAAKRGCQEKQHPFGDSPRPQGRGFVFIHHHNQKRDKIDRNERNSI
jgi:hypothetical protein